MTTTQNPQQRGTGEAMPEAITMGSDSAMRNMGLLNVLWDGGTHQTDRRTSESYTVRGARLTMSLQVQELALRTFFGSSKGLARGTGFLARFLVSWPESTQGTRFYTKAPDTWPALSAFNARMATLLAQAAPIDADGALSPALLTLSPEAMAAWVGYHDEIEARLATGGELQDIKDVASKIADNAARIACLFHVFSGRIGPVDFEAMESATRIVTWHLLEARRFFGEIAMPPELANPARLESWLLARCKQTGEAAIPTRDVQRHGPNGLRAKAAMDEALQHLADLGRAKQVKDGRKLSIQPRPELLEAQK